MTGKVCNNMNGSYTVDDNKISFGPVVSTKMFCQGLPGDVESAFSAGLESGYTMTKQGEDLVLQGSAVFVLEKN
jgi:heat shock protein HslJ